MSEPRPVAVIGSGQAGIATLINALVDIAYNTPDGAPPVAVVVIDTKDEAKPKGDAAYPVNGPSLEDLHPFDTDKPPTGFPTFGEYIKDMAKADPSLRSGLLTPTYSQINAYLEYLLELAILSFAQMFSLEINKATIADIQQTTQQGPATITFSDGTRLDVERVIRGKRPPHMAGPQPEEPAATPTRSEDRVPQASRLRLRDFLVILAGKLTFSAPEGTPPPPIWLLLANHKPDLDALPAERDFVNVPYVVEDADHEGSEVVARYFDPPRTGPAISYLEVLAKQTGFLYLLGSQKDGAAGRRQQEHAFRVLVHTTNTARDQGGPDYARGFIGRLHEHRWTAGSRLTAYLLIQAAGPGGQFYRRANDATFLTAHINGLRARIDRAKSEATDLTEWTEALYRLSPEVQELMAYLDASELKETKGWHRYFAQVDSDIMNIYRLNVNAATRQFSAASTAPTWTTTYLTDLRAGESAAEYRQRLGHLYQDRVAIPRYWYEAALSLYDTAVESIPGALAEIDPHRAVSIDVLESWSLHWQAARREGQAPT